MVRRKLLRALMMFESGLMLFIATFNDGRTLASTALLIRNVVGKGMRPWIDVYGELFKHLILKSVEIHREFM